MNRMVLFTSMNDGGKQLLPIIQAYCHERKWPTFDETNGVITIPNPPAEGVVGAWKLAVIWEYHRDREEYKSWLTDKQALLCREDNARGSVAVFCHRNTDVRIREDQQNFIAGLSISNLIIPLSYSHSPKGSDPLYDKLVQVLAARENSNEFTRLFDALWPILSCEEAYRVAMEIVAAYLPKYLAHSLVVAPSREPDLNEMQGRIDMLKKVSPNGDCIPVNDLKGLIGDLTQGNCVDRKFLELVQGLQSAYTVTGN